jgi:COP9 signalosome complex subunit 1
LENVLSNYRRDGERDQIKGAYINLANIYAERGDFTTALSKYLESREYAGNNKDILNICLAVIRCSILVGSASHVKTQAQRAKSLSEINNVENNVANAQINAALGIFNLKCNNYRAAASNFLAVTVDIKNNYKEIISARDCAIYACFCSLATMSRKELKEQLLNNTDFKSLLENASHWKAIVTAFNDSQYSQCLALLEKNSNELLLDRMIAPHVYRLINDIRNRALIQYFKPYSAINLNEMALAFSMQLNELERSLSVLIAEGRISARIDSHNKILHTKLADERNQTFQAAKTMGENYAKQAKSLLLRMSAIENEFFVKQNRGQKGEGEGGSEKPAANSKISREDQRAIQEAMKS